jgi:hypothetical protein
MKNTLDELMGYPMVTIEHLTKKAQEINRNRIIELNKRDLNDNGIEKD